MFRIRQSQSRVPQSLLMTAHGRLRGMFPFAVIVSLPLENTPLVARDFPAEIEESFSLLQADQPIQFEDSFSVARTDTLVNVEALVGQRRDQGVPLEALNGVLNERGGPVEALSLRTGDYAAPLEFLGVFSVNSDSAVQIEALSSGRRDLAALAETTASQRCAANMSLEILVSVQAVDRSNPISAEVAARSDGAAGVSSASSVTLDGGYAIELIRSFTSDKISSSGNLAWSFCRRDLPNGSGRRASCRPRGSRGRSWKNIG